MTDHSDDSYAKVPAGGSWSAADAAGFLLERLLAESKDRRSRTDEFALQSERSAGPSVTGLKVRMSLARSIDTYSEILRGLFESFAAETAALVSAPPASGDLPTPVTIVGRPGLVAGGVAWVHNTSDGVVPAFTLTMTDVSASDGTGVGADRFSADPSYFEASSEPRRSAWVSLLIPDDTVPGSYYGHLIANGLSDAAVPVRLIVR